MNWGKIYIATKTWQSCFPITDYDMNKKVVYFTVGDKDCMCSLSKPVVYNKNVDDCWVESEAVKDIVNVHVPEIQTI